MSDVGIRVVVVVIAVAIIAIAYALRPRPGATRDISSIDVTGVVDGPGVVLFTSSSCGTCERARDIVSRVCGSDGFTEVSWERQADALTSAGIDEVPLTVAVNRDLRPALVLRGTPSPWAVAKAVRLAR